ncbi:MAG: class I SAM-dependent methyltransferase [Rhizomicrobium sp.]|jgi:SAM-dependent methyltransferase
MAAASNKDQIEYWNGRTGQRWAAQQERIDWNLAEITEAVIPFAHARPGEHIVDIGCGCGTATLILARAVGPKGAVAGVDISAPMLAVARARAHAAQADIPFIEADASVHDFQPTFDLVFSRFGVMFFADPGPAFANIRKALAPNGRLAFVCWRAMPENAWAFAPFAAAKHLLPPQEAGDPHAPGPFAFADGARLTDILARAGFRDIKLEKFDGRMNMGDTAAEAANEALNIGPLARAAAELDEATRAKILDVVATAMQKFAGPRGIAPAAACWLVSAKG